MSSRRDAEDDALLRSRQRDTRIGKSNDDDEGAIANLRPGDDEGDDEFDREYYLADDDEAYVPSQDASDPSHQQDLGRFLFESDKTRQREAEMEKKRREGGLGGGVVPREQRRSARSRRRR